MLTSIKNNLFNQRMFDFVNKLEFSDHKYRNNGTVIYENYKGKFLFIIKDFVLFGTHN